MRTGKTCIRILTFVLGFITLCSTGKALAGDADGLKKEIEAVNTQWAKSFNSGDIAGVAAQYAEDAQAFPPNSDVVKGRQAIQGVFQGVMDLGVKSVKLATIEVTGMGDHAAEVGTYDLMDAAGKSVDHGKYIVVWKKVGSAWMLYRDIWNSSVPVPGTEMK